MSKAKWKYCDCVLERYDCGCGKVHVDNSLLQTIHWKGEHWALSCAFDAVLQKLAKKKGKKRKLFGFLGKLGMRFAEKKLGGNL